MFSEDFSPEDRRKLELAVKIAQSYFPYLGGIFATLDIRYDERIDTAAVTSCGKLLFGPSFLDSLAPGLETAFIVAHELLHLAQGIFERSGSFPDKESLNIAHDLLINELLCDTMGFPQPPCNGLSWNWFLQQKELPDWYRDAIILQKDYEHPIPGIQNPPEKASAFSLEELVRIIISVKDTESHPGRQSWKWRSEKNKELGSLHTVLANHPFADAFGDGSEKEKDRTVPAGGKKITLDILDDETEKDFFPDEEESERQQARTNVEAAVQTSVLQKIILSSSDKMICGTDAGNIQGNIQGDIEVIRSNYAPPWEMAMQRWFDGVAVSKRSWARASRRGAWRNDVVLPGRAQEIFMIHIVLDTSGSMISDIPYLLGQIGTFARSVGMEEVHILQCDTEVTKDELVEIDRLEKYRVDGFGGSDMSPAMLKLAEDPDVTSVLVITDGFIDYPPENEIPYDVLWCHPDTSPWPGIPYGRVIHVPIPEEE